MTEIPDVGRLTIELPRSVWPHESHHFTRWLLQNADVLGEILGMELVLDAAEHPVGGFALDLIGRDLTTDDVVIVENQLETTDHAHLGQLLTYGGGTDPVNIVWCAPRFRDEHRAALDWLNDRTDDNTRFFGVEIGVVRIDGSRPAPLFRLIAQPNSWTKTVRAQTRTQTGSQTPKPLAYQEFWSVMLDQIRQRWPGWTSASRPPADSWINLPFGTSGVKYGLVFTPRGLRTELYFDRPDGEANLVEFRRYLTHRDLMETRFGGPIEFEELPGKKACRIAVYGPVVDVLDRDAHAAGADWFLTTLPLFRDAAEAARSFLATKR